MFECMLIMPNFCLYSVPRYESSCLRIVYRINSGQCMLYKLSQKSCIIGEKVAFFLFNFCFNIVLSHRGWPSKAVRGLESHFKSILNDVNGKKKKNK